MTRWLIVGIAFLGISMAMVPLFWSLTQVLDAALALTTVLVLLVAAPSYAVTPLQALWCVLGVFYLVALSLVVAMVRRR